MVYVWGCVGMCGDVSRGLLLDDGENVVVVEEEEVVLAIDRDLGATVLGKENSVTDRDSSSVAVTPRTHSHNLGLVGLHHTPQQSVSQSALSPQKLRETGDALKFSSQPPFTHTVLTHLPLRPHTLEHRTQHS